MKDKQRLALDLPIEIHSDIKKRAADLHMPMSKYILNAIVEMIHKEVELNHQ